MGIGIYIGNMVGRSSGSSYWTPPIGAFYVSSSTGNDALDGLSSINAWRTLAKVNSYAFDSGAYIAFKKDDVWRETLIISRNGSAGSPITFGYYGSGALLPVINGADIITGFAADTGTLGTELSPNVTFDADVNGWGGIQITHQAGAIGGRSNTAKMTAAGAGSFATWAADLGLTTIAHTITFDIYIPSTNAKTNSVRVREGQTSWAYINDTTPMADTWVTVTVHRTPASGNTYIYIYGAKDANDGDNQVGDVFYIDNFSIKADAVPIANLWNVALATQPNIVLVNGARGAYKASKALCTISGDWFWASNVLNVYYVGDPSGFVEAGIRAQCVSGIGNYNSFSHIKFTANQTFSIYVTGTDINIQNCTITKVGGRGQNGIGVLVGGARPVISYNIITDIQSQGIADNGGGNIDGIVFHNTISDCWNLIPYPGQSGGGVSCGIEDWEISYNTISGCGKGILPGGSKSTLIHHNIVVNNIVNGIDVSAPGVDGFPILVYNNTIIHNPHAPGSGHGLDIQLSNGYVKFKNNLIYITFITDNVNVQGLCIQDSTYLDIDEDYNLVYKIPTSTAYLYKIDASLPDTLADWQIALAATAFSGKGVHDLSADPLFVDFAGGDYHLQAGSPALGAGVDVGLGETNPNIGAL